MFLSRPERWILCAFALFRLTWTVIHDDGPFDILVRARTALGVYDLQENQKPKQGVASFLSCAYCVSRFLALLAIPLVVWPNAIGDLFLVWYGIAGILALLIRWRPWTNY